MRKEIIDPNKIIISIAIAFIILAVSAHYYSFPRWLYLICGCFTAMIALSDLCAKVSKIMKGPIQRKAIEFISELIVYISVPLSIFIVWHKADNIERGIDQYALAAFGIFLLSLVIEKVN